MVHHYIMTDLSFVTVLLIISAFAGSNNSIHQYVFSFTLISVFKIELKTLLAFSIVFYPQLL